MVEIINKDLLLELGYRILVVVLIFMITWIFAQLVKRTMARKTTFVRIDSIQYKFLAHFLNMFIYFLGMVIAVYSVPLLRGLATPIFAGSGVIAIIIGFASQHAFSNIVGGIFIALFRPFRIGDRLKLVEKNFIGIVEDISLRHTIIRTFDNKRIIIPNSVISTEVLENENIIDQKMIRYFEVHVSYDSNLDQAIKIIEAEAMAHPDFLDNRTDEQKEANEKSLRVRVLELGRDSILLRAYIWTRDPSAAFNLGCDMNKSVKERFEREGISIPFPHRMIIHRNQEK